MSNKTTNYNAPVNLSSRYIESVTLSMHNIMMINSFLSFKLLYQLQIQSMNTKERYLYTFW